MFPQLPANLNDRSANPNEALRALELRYVEAIKAFNAERSVRDRPAEEREQLRQALADLETIRGELDGRALSDAADAVEPSPEPEPSPAPAPAAADVTPEPDLEPTPEPTPTPDPEPEADPDDLANQTPTPVPTGTSTGSQPAPANAGLARRSRIQVLGERVPEIADMTNASWEDLAHAINHFAANVGETDRKWQVAQIHKAYDERATLTGDLTEDWRKLNQPMNDPDIMAALCGPMTEVTAMARIPLNTARSVTPGMANFNADAANVRVWEAPMWSDTDVGTAVGQWTSTDDAAVTLTGGPRKGCFEIPCATSVDYELYAVWACIEIANLLTLSFPQLITIYNDMVLSHHSQLGDDLALAFINAATAVDYKDGLTASDAPDYGVLLRTIRTMVRARADYIQKERYQGTVMFDAWMPKSLQQFFFLDLLSRRATNGTFPSAQPSDVDAAFQRFGFDIHWYEDPTYKLSATVGSFEVEKATADMDIVIRTAPKGKFRFIDKGRLNVGVIGSGGYRDSELVARNRFRVFFETFETVIDTMAAPAVDINILNACANGVQIDDRVLDCHGFVV